MSVQIESREILDQKPLLTLREAAVYTGIGINRLRRMSNEPNCDYVLFVGSKRMFKRQALLQFWSASTRFNRKTGPKGG